MTHRVLVLLLASLFAGCSGQISAADDDSDAASGVDGGADGGPAGPTFAVTGTTKDYSGGDPLPAIALATEGLDPQLQTESDVAGAFALQGVPASSSFYFHAMPS